MKLRNIYILAILLVVGTALLYLNRSKAPTFSATNLRVDYIRVPEQTEIKSENQIFSWQLPVESKAQRAYQIVVSSANDENSVVWDSGRVEGKNSSSVEYGGEKLRAGESYCWKVRFWDYLDRESVYSDCQKFTMSTMVRDSSSTIVSDNLILIREDLPVARTQMTDSVFQFDFGKAAFGSLSLRFKASNADSIAVRVGEQLDSTGRISVKPNGTSVYYKEAIIAVDTTENVYKVDMPVDKRNTGPMAIHLPDSLGVIFPFRYVEVCNITAQDTLILEPIRKVTYGYKDENIGHFQSSDTLLNDIWDICKYTIQATDLFGCYIDGERERIPYEADSYLNQLSHYCIDSEYAIAKKTLEYFMSHATWPTEWLLHTPMIAYQDYMYTGDTRMFERYYDMLKMKSLHELSREDGLISSKTGIIDRDYMEKLGYRPGVKKVQDIVDWPPAEFSVDGVGERDYHDMVDYNTVVNCFFYHTMGIMSDIATVLGKQEDAIMFADRAVKVKVAINEKLFDREKGIYIDGEGSTHSSLHSNMFALAFDIVPEDQVQSVVDFVKSRGLVCSVYGAQYLLEALYKAGEDQYALDLMTNTSKRSWYNMIKIGSTMTLEAWDAYYKKNLDWNHAWGAAPANIIPRMMWGINPTAPAYQQAIIKPQMADLTESVISVPTILGAIKGSYKITDGVKVYEVEIPANMGAIFDLGKDADKLITFNGEAISNNHSKLQLLTGYNKIVIK